MMDFPGGSEGKMSAYNVGDPASIPGLRRSPGEGNGNPFQYSCLEKSHGRWNLVGYSPWGRKESDTTEQLHNYFRNSRQQVPWIRISIKKKKKKAKNTLHLDRNRTQNFRLKYQYDLRKGF